MIPWYHSNPDRQYIRIRGIIYYMTTRMPRACSCILVQTHRLTRLRDTNEWVSLSVYKPLRATDTPFITRLRIYITKLLFQLFPVITIITVITVSLQPTVQPTACRLQQPTRNPFPIPKSQTPNFHLPFLCVSIGIRDLDAYDINVLHSEVYWRTDVLYSTHTHTLLIIKSLSK